MFTCAKCRRANTLACAHNTEVLSSYGLDHYAIEFLQQGPCGGNEFFIDGNFYHYKGASWDSSVDHYQKTNLVAYYMNAILNS